MSPTPVSRLQRVFTNVASALLVIGVLVLVLYAVSNQQETRNGVKAVANVQTVSNRNAVPILCATAFSPTRGDIPVEKARDLIYACLERHGLSIDELRKRALAGELLKPWPEKPAR